MSRLRTENIYLNKIYLLLLLQLLTILFAFTGFYFHGKEFVQNNNFTSREKDLILKTEKLGLQLESFFENEEIIDPSLILLKLNEYLSNRIEENREISVSFKSLNGGLIVRSGKILNDNFVFSHSINLKIKNIKGVLSLNAPEKWKGIINKNKKIFHSNFEYLIFLGVMFILILMFFQYSYLREFQKAQILKEKQTRKLEIGDLAAGLAHEIRNPLNSVRFNIKMIEDDLEDRETDEDLKNMIESTIDEVDRLDRMLKSYMEFAGTRDNQKIEKINIDKLIMDIISFHQEEFNNKGIALITKFNVENLIIEADPQILRQIIVNILINAREIMNNKGAVYIETEKKDDEVHISIQDEGPGIDESIMDKIFEPFFSKRDGGFGLGLATVKKLLDETGGKIEISNTEKGARFTIIL